MSRIYLTPVGGLCNRMRAIDSVLSIARESDKRLVVNWEKNRALNCAYHDLFQPSDAFDLIETKPIAGYAMPFLPSNPPNSFLKRTMFSRSQKKFGISSTTFFESLGKILDELRPVTPDKYQNVHQFDELTYQAFAPIVEKLKTPESNFISTCWRMIRTPNYRENFQPAASIVESVEKITKQFTNDTFGIHIRGTDAVTARKFSSVEAFERRMDLIIAENDNASFFLASDEPAIKQKLVNKYDSRIFLLDQTGYARDSPANIKNAMVDLLCLANTQKIYGSYFSTFSQLAANWHGIEEVTVFNEGVLNAA